MSRKNPQHTKQFKWDVINYCKEHPDLTQTEVAKNLGIGISTLARWETVKKNIQVIYDDSRQNYRAHKITQKLRKSGKTIAERTVGKYMCEMRIKAQG